MFGFALFHFHTNPPFFPSRKVRKSKTNHDKSVQDSSPRIAPINSLIYSSDFFKKCQPLAVEFLEKCTSVAVSGTYRGRIGAVSRPYRGRIGAVSGPYRGHIGAISGPYRGRIGAVSGPYRGRIGAKTFRNMHCRKKTCIARKKCIGS